MIWKVNYLHVSKLTIWYPNKHNFFCVWGGVIVTLWPLRLRSGHWERATKMWFCFGLVKSEVKSAERNVRQCVHLCRSAHLQDRDYHAIDGCLESEKPFITSFDVFMTKMLKHLTAQRLKEAESCLQVLAKTSPKALSTHVLIETSINQLRSRAGGDPRLHSVRLWRDSVWTFSWIEINRIQK